MVQLVGHIEAVDEGIKATIIDGLLNHHEDQQAGVKGIRLGSGPLDIHIDACIHALAAYLILQDQEGEDDYSSTCPRELAGQEI